MAITPYNKTNAKFSDLAHYAARQFIYPKMFNTLALQYYNANEHTTEVHKILDMKMAIDKIVYVSYKKHRLIFPIQERFRKIEYSNFRDITITKWNNNSGTPSELYKLCAGMFLYGYYNITSNIFGEVIAINIPGLIYKLSLGKLYIENNINEKNQDFICIKFDELQKENLILFHHYG